MRTIEEPVITREEGPLEGSEHSHPAFAQILACRVSGSAVLYGSDFKHNSYIRIQVSPSVLKRSLSRDWHFAGRQPYIEVEISEAQWAHFVSSLNVGTGTPCTVSMRDGQPVPGLPDPVDRSAQFSTEHDERMERAQKSLEGLREALASSGLSKKKLEDLVGLLDDAHRNMVSNRKFVAKQFGEHVERTVEAAKSEVDGYVQGAIRHVGLQALAASQQPELLPMQLSFPDSPKNSP